MSFGCLGAVKYVKGSFIGEEEGVCCAGQKRVEGGRYRYLNERRPVLFCSGNKPNRRIEKRCEDSASAWARKICMGVNCKPRTTRVP